jgi:hypothetical protein
MRSHSFRDLRLRKARVLARLEQRVKQRTFLALDPFDFGPYAGTTQQLLYQLVMRLHV